MFGIEGLIQTEAITAVSADVQIGLADGHIHLDALKQKDSYTSGWTPTYVAAASLDAETTAEIDTTATLTVEITILFFGGLVDLSTGLTAKPAFLNTFTLSGGKTLSTTVAKTTTTGTCAQGIELQSVFDLSIVGFATSWLKATLYSVSVPIVDECYDWTS